MIPDEAELETLFQDGVLCQVCEERPWTQHAQYHAARICASCAEGEPVPDDEDRAAQRATD